MECSITFRQIGLRGKPPVLFGGVNLSALFDHSKGLNACLLATIHVVLEQNLPLQGSLDVLLFPTCTSKHDRANLGIDLSSPFLSHVTFDFNRIFIGPIKKRVVISINRV